ncbi:nuclear transport factor 2 family protein [Pedobacter sp.]|uniref:nuclear transport factor 2 family protein n=1 Tax=Pedobacter sp. TaxID=1411316 RepID=UPI0031CFC654
MNADNKQILLNANRCVTKGDYEGFLLFCTENIKYEFIGDKTLQGKEALRAYMKEAYIEPPVFNVEKLIAEGDFLTAIGKISMKDKSGEIIDYSYCDVWRFDNDKMAALKAFVIKTP